MPELTYRANEPVMDIYNSFNQAAKQLSGLVAVDYFFAKEISESIAFSTPVTAEVLGSKTYLNQQQWFHLLVALSASLRDGHSCLPLAQVAGKRLFCDGTLNSTDANEKANEKPSAATAEAEIETKNKAENETQQSGFLFSDSNTLTMLLAQLPLVAAEQQPIVLSHGRLYLRRYYQFEQELQQVVATRSVICAEPTDDNATKVTRDVEQVSHIIATLFPGLAKQQSADCGIDCEIDWQAVAVANAINKDFAIIAGGPGTGKTYTVTKLLAALLMLASADSAAPRIALVAPTGKAAQRLSESITKAVKGFRGEIDDKVLDLIPEQAQTIHRLLGVIPEQVNFRHHQENLLAVDILLIDEVSMVDLPMMTRIFRALPASTKVILLGDADQLPSVAVGSVLADFAQRPHPGYSFDNYHYLSQVTGYQHLKQDNTSSKGAGQYSQADCVTFLMKSRRFDGEGAIGRMANYVIQGQYQESWQLLQQSASITENNKQLTWLSESIETWLAPLVEQYYLPLSQCDTVQAAFALLAKFRILSPTRKGPQGVESLNALVMDILRDKGAITANRFDSKNTLYSSQPIMISENDYRLGVFNGDIGLLWRNSQGHLMAVFENAQGDYDWILPSRLPAFETVYAMTIHKTQGSEFNHVAMVLPEQKDNKLLSRELLYTGITRAKQHLSIASNQQVWQTGVSGQVKRYSGLAIEHSASDS